MSFSRKILNQYRGLLNIIFGRKSKAILLSGDEMIVEKYTEESHGDIVHPCVRYSEKGCLGHKWWMIYTPYFMANPATENPILCYGDSETSECPTKWHFHSLIKPQPERGYNSDPNLLIEGKSLVVFWRENQTKRCIDNNCSRATFAIRISEDGIKEYPEPLLRADEEFLDAEVSPAFIKCDSEYMAYATSVRFFSKWVRKLPKPFRFITNKILLLIDLAGIYPLHKSFGIAVWKGESISKPFHKVAANKIKNTNRLYQPWHLDVFEYKNSLYAVIQTGQCNADICLAKSVNGVNFTFYKQPLITNKSIGKIGLYKPCGIVVDGTFHLFYTAQDLNNRALNRLFHTSIDFEKLLNLL